MYLIFVYMCLSKLSQTYNTEFEMHRMCLGRFEMYISESIRQLNAVAKENERFLLTLFYNIVITHYTQSTEIETINPALYAPPMTPTAPHLWVLSTGV
jgi:hypothetical protein